MSIQIKTPTSGVIPYTITLPPSAPATNGQALVVSNTGVGNWATIGSPIVQTISMSGNSTADSNADTIYITNGNCNIILPSAAAALHKQYTVVCGGQPPLYLSVTSSTAAMAINAIAYDSTRNVVYLAGSFDSILDTPVSGLAAVSLTTGSLIPFPSIEAGSNKYILTLYLDQTNTYLYVGGFNFTCVYNSDFSSYTSCGGAFRITLSNQTITPINVKPGVYTFVADEMNSTLYLGGNFDTVNIDSFSRNVVGLNTTGAGSTVKTFFGATDVSAVAFDSTYVYVGGSFTKIANVTMNRICRFFRSTGSLDLNWNPNANNNVIGLALDATNSVLYVSGSFTSIGGQTRNYIAKINTNDTGTANATWNPSMDNSPISMALDTSNSALYVGGNFTSIGGQIRNSIAKINTNTGAADATWNPNATGGVNSMALDTVNSFLYVGGTFTNIGGQIRNRIAKISTTGAGAADATWNPSANGAVNSMTLGATNSVLYVSGSFTSIGGQTRNYIAKISIATNATGAADATWNPNANNSPISMALDTSNSVLYVGGNFTSIGGQTRNYIAKINTNTGAADATWNSNLNNKVNTLALDMTNSIIYAGGSFDTVGGITSMKYLASCPMSTLIINTTWNPFPNSFVTSLLFDATNSALYVGGDFALIGSTSRSRIAKLPGTGAGAADATWNPNAIGGTVDAFALDTVNSALYVGGAFTSIGSQTRNRIAKISTAGAGAADATWNPNSTAAVKSLVLDTINSALYVGGAYNTIGSSKSISIAKLSTIGKGDVDMLWNPGFNNQVNCLTFASGSLFVGGAFSSMNNNNRNVGCCRLLHNTSMSGNTTNEKIDGPSSKKYIYETPSAIKLINSGGNYWLVV